MGKGKNPDRKKAFDLFEKHGGDITNRAIAKKLKINEKTVSVWKYRDKWKDNLSDEKRSTSERECSTSNEVEKEIDGNSRNNERKRIINALDIAKSYSPALDILIDVYLDCFEEYQHAKSEDMETESLRRELARILGQLGLNINNKTLVQSIERKDKKETKPKEQEKNKLVQFRQRMST